MDIWVADLASTTMHTLHGYCCAAGLAFGKWNGFFGRGMYTKQTLQSQQASLFYTRSDPGFVFNCDLRPPHGEPAEVDTYTGQYDGGGRDTGRE